MIKKTNNKCSIQFGKKYVNELIKNHLITFPTKIRKPKIVWKSMGLITAGCAVLADNEIQLNSNYLNSEDWKRFLDIIPLHELAHLIAFKLYGDEGHGKCWKNVCIQLGIKPDRCHTLKTPIIPGTTKLKTHKGYCGCMEWDISQIRYNRMKKGTIYYCTICKQPIILNK